MLRVLPRSEVDGSAKGHNASAESRILRRSAAPVKKSQIDVHNNNRTLAVFVFSGSHVVRFHTGGAPASPPAVCLVCSLYMYIWELSQTYGGHGTHYPIVCSPHVCTLIFFFFIPFDNNAIVHFYLSSQ